VLQAPPVGPGRVRLPSTLVVFFEMKKVKKKGFEEAYDVNK